MIRKFLLALIFCGSTLIAKSQNVSVEQSTFGIQTGIGIGYVYTFAKNAGYLKNESDVAGNLHLRIGYRF